MSRHIFIVLILISLSLPNSLIGQTSLQHTNVLILKDGQELSVDSVKINQLDCELTFKIMGSSLRQSICIGFAQLYYDARGFARNFDDRPCTCEKITYIPRAVEIPPQSTNDVMVLMRGEQLLVDIGSIQIDTKKLTINYSKNKKKQKVKYCDIREIHFVNGIIQMMDRSVCK